MKTKSKEKSKYEVTHVMKLPRTIRSFSSWLFGHVYSQVSALVWLDEKGTPVDFFQFDTFVGPPRSLACAAQEYKPVLLSNHPEGGLSPMADDLKNLETLVKFVGKRPDLYIACGCKCLAVEEAS